MIRRRLIPSFLLSALLCAAPAVRAQEETEADRATPEEVLTWADREFSRDSYESAEELYRKLLEKQPGNTHAMSRLALLLTWKGQYPEAIDLYRKAIALDSSRIEARRGLATAYTWSEDYASAISLYRELLQERPGDEGLTFEMAQAQAWSGDFSAAESTLRDLLGRNPRHSKARLLLAQVHDWRGESAEAEKIYRSLLAEDAGNIVALNGLGAVLTAQGHYEEALAAYDRALTADPQNRAALEGRARVFHWQGRTPEALDAVRQALELYPDARDARRLGREIGGPLRPTLQLFANTTRDTDDNDLATWGGTYTHYIGGKGYAGFTFTHAQTDARSEANTPGANDTPVAKYDTLRAIGGWHFSRHLSIYGELGAERTTFPPNTDSNEKLADSTHEHGAGSVTVEINGAEWFTLVGSVSQEALAGTTQAFLNDIGIRAATLTAILRPHSSLRLRLTGQKARFTDDDDFDVDSSFQVDPNSDSDPDNHRDLVTAAASWKLPLRRPRLHLHYKFRWMSYEEDLDHGYFDPDHFVSNTAGFDLSDSIGKHFYWGAGADAGFQRVNDRDDGVFSYRLLAGLNIGDRASIEGYYSGSDHAVQSASGFRSTEAGVRLKLRFGASLGPASPTGGVSSGASGIAD